MATPKQKIHVVPFNLADLTAGTRHMTAAEFGAYMRLLIWHYEQGADGIPDDDNMMTRVVGTSRVAWMKMRPIVVEKFHGIEAPDPRGGTRRVLTQKRVCEELKKIAVQSEQAKDKALKRWNPEDAPALPLQSQGNATASASLKAREETALTGSQEAPKSVFDNFVKHSSMSSSEVSGSSDFNGSTLAEYLRARDTDEIPAEWVSVARVMLRTAGRDPAETPAITARFFRHFTQTAPQFRSEDWPSKYSTWMRTPPPKPPK